MHAAARRAAPRPFQLRPGLVAEMMRFYDQLRRRGRASIAYESLLVESLTRTAIAGRAVVTADPVPGSVVPGVRAARRRAAGC